MNLTHLSLEQLKLSTLNVRSKGGKDIADLVPSIRSLGIIQPLLVRPNCEGFEIVAGQRRYHALIKLAEEGINEPVPVIVMEEGDNAKTIEASLAENVARLPMDEIDQYKAFAGLKAEGMAVADIAARFGVSERLVSQRLAIAGIIAPILSAYRREEIDPETLRILTMATPRQQKAWWALFKEEGQNAPMRWRLRAWLFGGAQVPVTNALFDVAEYDGAIVSDLFGDERYFAGSEAFWSMQNAAIAARREAYLAAGWAEVVVLDIGEHFAKWCHVKTPKSKGGKVFVSLTQDGEVGFHEGWITEKEARALARQKQPGKEQQGDVASDQGVAGKPEMTKAMQNYLGLHKHAAVRTELLAVPGIALRLAVAHLIAGSGLWSVKSDPQRPDSEAIGSSLAASKAEEGFAQERRRIRLLLGIGDGADVDDGEAIVPGQRDWQSNRSLGDIFERLISMEDKTVLRILTFVMAETLEAQSGTVEALGVLLGTDMRNWWTPDQTFFDRMRDKEAINGMVREVAGDVTADAHVASTAKVQKQIVADCLTGEDRARVEGWMPRYLEFPAKGYTGRFVGPVRSELLTDETEGDLGAGLNDAA